MMSYCLSIPDYASLSLSSNRTTLMTSFFQYPRGEYTLFWCVPVKGACWEPGRLSLPPGTTGLPACYPRSLLLIPGYWSKFVIYFISSTDEALRDPSRLWNISTVMGPWGVCEGSVNHRAGRWLMEIGDITVQHNYSTREFGSTRVMIITCTAKCNIKTFGCDVVTDLFRGTSQ